MTGPERLVRPLQHYLSVQMHNHKRFVYYGNIEGRLKKRDLEGIEIQLGPEQFQMVGSSEGNTFWRRLPWYL